MPYRLATFALASFFIVANSFGQFDNCTGTTSKTCTTQQVGAGQMTPTNALHVFSSSNAGGLTVEGSTNPALRFESSGVKGYFGLATAATGFFSESRANDLVIRSESGRILMGTLGAFTLSVATSKVGVGIADPADILHVKGSATADGVLIEGDNSPAAKLKSGSSIGGYFALASVDGAYFQNSHAQDVILRGDANRILIGQYGTTNTPATLVVGNGHVGIGTAPSTSYTVDVSGSIHADQVIGSTYQDVAEWVPARGTLTPGTVVVIDPDSSNGVVESSAPYQTSVAGVVSPQPGVLLGSEGPAKAKIATTGRVRIRVDATSAPIRRGDLLVSSGKNGMDMRSEPIEIGGRKFHQPGTVIGKALEPLASGEGEILVLLSLQ